MIGNTALKDYSVCFADQESIQESIGNPNDTPRLIEVTGKGVIGNDLNGKCYLTSKTLNPLKPVKSSE